MFTITIHIAKRKEIDVKLVYLNLGSDKVAALSVFPTFSGTDIKVISLHITSFDTQVYSLVLWIIMLFPKVRKLNASALCIQANAEAD